VSKLDNEGLCYLLVMANALLGPGLSNIKYTDLGTIMIDYSLMCVCVCVCVCVCACARVRARASVCELTRSSHPFRDVSAICQFSFKAK